MLQKTLISIQREQPQTPRFVNYGCSLCSSRNKQIVYKDWCRMGSFRLCYICALKVMPNIEEIKNLIICEGCGRRFLPKWKEHKICYNCWRLEHGKTN